MLSFLLIFTYLFLLAYATHSVDLLTALRASNAIIFADKLANDPDLLAFYTSSDVRTVFAPVDNVFANTSLLQRSLVARAEESLEDVYGASRTQSDTSLPARPVILDTASTRIPTNNERGNQVMVTIPNVQQVLKKRNESHYDPKSHFQVVSGLGNKVTVVSPFVGYDRGYIHTIDG